MGPHWFFCWVPLECDGNMSTCLDDDTIGGYARRELSGLAEDTAEEHLLLCQRCRQRVEEYEQLTTQTRLLLKDYDLD